MTSRGWCWEEVPGFPAHYCVLRPHTGQHFANMCGEGRKGGRKARWTCEEDLEVTGPTGRECGRCTSEREKAGRRHVRVQLLRSG